MKRITFAEARSMDVAGPFSFVSECGLRNTRIQVCLDDTITAAVCVKPSEHPGLLTVVTHLCPMGGAR